MFINQKTRESAELFSSPAREKPALDCICIPSAVFHCSVDCSLAWEVAPGLRETPKQQLTPASFMCWKVPFPANEECLFSPAEVYIQDVFPVWSPHLTPQITICHMLMYFRYRWRHYSCNPSHGKSHRLATLSQLKHSFLPLLLREKNIQKLGPAQWLSG